MPKRHHALANLCHAASIAGCKDVLVPVGKLQELIRELAHLRSVLDARDGQQPPPVV